MLQYCNLLNLHFVTSSGVYLRCSSRNAKHVTVILQLVDRFEFFLQNLAESLILFDNWNITDTTIVYEDEHTSYIKVQQNNYRIALYKHK